MKDERLGIIYNSNQHMFSKTAFLPTKIFQLPYQRLQPMIVPFIVNLETDNEKSQKRDGVLCISSVGI